eukprot:XP_019928582.1 PREDICTED: uncharacterized protein LOC109620469 [Crassostrea gigas]
MESMQDRIATPHLFDKPCEKNILEPHSFSHVGTTLGVISARGIRSLVCAIEVHFAQCINRYIFHNGEAPQSNVFCKESSDNDGRVLYVVVAQGTEYFATSAVFAIILVVLMDQARFISKSVHKNVVIRSGAVWNAHYFLVEGSDVRGLGLLFLVIVYQEDVFCSWFHDFVSIDCSVLENKFISQDTCADVIFFVLVTHLDQLFAVFSYLNGLVWGYEKWQFGGSVFPLSLCAQNFLFIRKVNKFACDRAWFVLFVPTIPVDVAEFVVSLLGAERSPYVGIPNRQRFRQAAISSRGFASWLSSLSFLKESFPILRLGPQPFDRLRPEGRPRPLDRPRPLGRPLYCAHSGITFSLVDSCLPERSNGEQFLRLLCCLVFIPDIMQLNKIQKSTKIPQT